VWGSGFRPATAAEIVEGFGADPGSIGPLPFDGEVIADDTLREGQFVTGANRTGLHLRGVQAGRDFEPRFADIREPREGDACPRCGGALRFQTAIEVGHIFKFGTFYSKPLEATYLDETGRERPLIGGSYGIGPGRVLAAAVEQHHDEAGMVWPSAIAPYDATIVALGGMEEQASELGQRLEAAGTSILLDDRDLSAGYLNHVVHGNRPVPANDVVERIARALRVEPEHFLEYRVRFITERLEQMPELVDRLYRRLG